MIQSITVSNYALIQQLEIEFNSGLSIITGETGAGKSILLGALSLILGNRAESSVLHNKEKKCIIEGIFEIDDYGLQDFFKKNDLDFSRHCIVRREILPSGKSRAFVNDTPVNLNLLKELGRNLVDVHSQHQSLLLADNRFQLKVIDEFAKNNELLTAFKSAFLSYINERNKLEQLIQNAERAKSELDYLQFQYEQLKSARLIDENEQDVLESELKILTHAEEIKRVLNNVEHMLSDGEDSALSRINQSVREVSNLKGLLSKAEEIHSRLESVIIELSDIVDESVKANENIEFQPSRIEELNERLNTIYLLEQKHQVAAVSDLIKLRNELENRIVEIESFDDELKEQEKKCGEIANHANKLAVQLSEARNQRLPGLVNNIINLLKSLGLKNATFEIKNTKNEDLTINGIDNFSFWFSANKKSPSQEIQKVASGGEISRLMLCIKSLLSKSSGLPTIIFDEIDTGVSGDIADKVGEIMKQMSVGMQVINITHLPQVAAKGDFHYLVYKDESRDISETRIRLLSGKSRIDELAKMLSGKDVSEAAIENARVLLEQNSS